MMFPFLRSNNNGSRVYAWLLNKRKVMEHRAREELDYAKMDSDITRV